MEAPSLERWVGDQVLDAEQLTYELHEARRIQPFEDALERWSPRGGIGVAELALVDVEVVVPPIWVEGWELVDRGFESYYLRRAASLNR